MNYFTHSKLIKTHTANKIKLHTANKIKLHAANKKKTSARAGKYAANEMRGPGYEVVHVFSNMASFLRQEIKDAVKEEISRVLSTGEERSTGSDLPSSSRTEKQSKRELTLTFEEFYSLREEERQEGFKPPKKKKKQSQANKSSVPSSKVVDVEVKVGVASQVDGIFKGRRGKTHFVSVKTTADKDDITKKAVAKHSSFDQNFDGTISYLLLFPDFSEVNFVPGTKEQFVLSSYKRAIGKDYKRLTFYLIPAEEFEDRDEDTDNSSAEECAKDQGIAKYFTGSAAGCSTKESIDLSDDDEKPPYVDAPASLEGKFYACTIS